MPPKITDGMIPVKKQYGLVQRAGIALAKTVNYLNNKVVGLELDDWFNPGQPMQATPGKADPGRVYDYPVNWNLNYMPRATEGVSFEQLIMVADVLPLLRIIIETRKDQIAKLPWQIQHVDKNLEKKDQAIDDLNEFFKYPDRNREHPFQTWLRMILEDALVSDSASVFVHPSKLGTPWALRPLDGSTIHPLLDDIGQRPMEGPAYQQIIKGTPKFYYTQENLIYRPRVKRTNRVYGFSPVEQILMTINLAIRREVTKLEWYTSGNMPEGFLLMPPEMSMDQIEEWYRRFDAKLAGQPQQRSKIVPIPGDGTSKANIIFPKEVLLKDEMDEWLARIVCYTFSVSPTAFVKGTNRATAQSLADAALEEGLYPWMAWIKDLMDHCIQQVFGFKHLQFNWTYTKKVDPLVQAQTDQINVSMGLRSVDELRIRDGLDPIGLPHSIQTPSGIIFVGGSYQDKGGLLMPGQATSEPFDGAAPDGGAKPAKPGLPGGQSSEPKKLAAGDRADAKPPKPEPLEKATPTDHLSSPEQQPASTEVNPQPMSKAAPSEKKKREVERPPFGGQEEVTELAKIITKFFKGQGPKVARQVADQFGKRSTLAKAADDGTDETDGLDFSAWYFLAAPISKRISKVGAASGKAALDAIDITFDSDVFTTVNQAALDYAESRGAEMVGRKLVDGELVDNPDARWAITDSTRNLIRGQVKTALEEGWSTDKLRREIEDGNGFSRERAENIAQTELSNAYAKSTRDAWKASGVVESRHSLLSSDHSVEDECDTNADAGDVPLDQPYPSGDDAPPFHVKCFCSEVATLSASADVQ